MCSKYWNMSALKILTFLICNICTQCNRQSARMLYPLHLCDIADLFMTPTLLCNFHIRSIWVVKTPCDTSTGYTSNYIFTQLCKHNDHKSSWDWMYCPHSSNLVNIGWWFNRTNFCDIVFFVYIEAFVRHTCISCLYIFLRKHILPSY